MGPRGIGDQHMKQVYETQLYIRKHKAGEALQEFQAYVRRLPHLAYPKVPTDFQDMLATGTFVDGLREIDVKRVLQISSFATSSEALICLQI